MSKLDFLKKNVYKFGAVVPCTQEDIISLERDLKIALPEVYKKFLLICGRASGIYLKEDFAHYRYIREIQEFNIEMRGYCKYPPPLKGDLTVLTNYDDGIAFINVGDVDDPPVYYYDRVSWPPKMAYHSLSECYLKKLVYFLELESRLTGKDLHLE
ncbi:MAG: SMI1/KNR4 family protein [Saprospiraceae bacterium]